MRWRRRRSGADDAADDAADHGADHGADPESTLPADPSRAQGNGRAEGSSEGRRGPDGADGADAGVGGEPVAGGSAPGVSDLVENAELVVARLGAHVEFSFGWDRRSLVWVEEFLERQRSDPRRDAEALVSVLGSFLGQCLISAGGGHWVQRPEGWCVSSPRIDAFPLTKVEKQARHGLAGGESIVSFYDLTLEIARSPFPHEDEP